MGDTIFYHLTKLLLPRITVLMYYLAANILVQAIIVFWPPPPAVPGVPQQGWGGVSRVSRVCPIHAGFFPPPHLPPAAGYSRYSRYWLASG